MQKRLENRLNRLEGHARRIRSDADPDAMIRRLMFERTTTQARTMHGLPPLTELEKQRLDDACDAVSKACEDAGVSPLKVRLDRIRASPKYDFRPHCQMPFKQR